MPDVRMPDGTIIRNVPEGTTRSELQRRLNQAQAPQAQGNEFESIDRLMRQEPQSQRQPSIADRARSIQVDLPEGEISSEDLPGIGEMFGRTFINNVLAIPAASGEALAMGAGLAETAAGTARSMVTGQEQDQGFMERFGEATERQRQQFPASAIRQIPRVTASDIAAGTEAVTGAGRNLLQGEAPQLGEQFREGQQRQQQMIEQMEGTAAGETGEVLGDVATILTGRAPLARRRARASQQRRSQVEQEFRERIRIPDELQDELNDSFTRNIVPFIKGTGRGLKRGTGRAVEGGIEGATLAFLQEGDPSAMFGLGAGAQAAGSLGLHAAEKPVKRLLPYIGTGIVVHEMWKAAAPGPQNFFESKDFAINMAVAGFAAGAVGALSGAGRLRGPTADKFPELFDAVTAAPRGAVRSRLEELTKNAEEGNNTPQKVLERFVQNPGAFSHDQQNALGRALNSEREGAFTREVERLMRSSESFRDAVRRNEQ